MTKWFQFVDISISWEVQYNGIMETWNEIIGDFWQWKKCLINVNAFHWENIVSEFAPYFWERHFSWLEHRLFQLRRTKPMQKQYQQAPMCRQRMIVLLSIQRAQMLMQQQQPFQQVKVCLQKPQVNREMQKQVSLAQTQKHHASVRVVTPLLSQLQRKLQMN